MIAKYRTEFNSRVSEALTAKVRAELERQSGCAIDFRIAETPLFLSKEVAAQVARSAEELLVHAASTELQEIGKEAIPPQWNVAAETERPLFAAVDFAITGSSVAPEFKLIELQGFPSLYHYQAAFSETVREVYGLPQEWNGLFRPELGMNAYYDLLRTAIIANNDPAEVALVETKPHEQKTKCDFYLAAKQLGIRIVDIASIVAKGKQLFAPDEQGTLIPIKRIYNRAIVDELERKSVSLQFDIRKEYDVQWAGHPNWYFRISKILLPKLVGVNETVPNAYYVDEADIAPLDLSKFVLKPLYSFAGLGVNVSPTKEDIDRIAVEERHQLLLQEKVEYAEVIRTPDGNGVRAELRALCLWLPQWERPQALHTLVRLTRGKMVGVDYNKGLDWVGSSCALIG
jgi:hypothetical protein